MSDVLPITEFLATGLPAFIAGVLVGAYRERHKRDKESFMRHVVDAYNGWYARWAPIVVSVVALVAVIGLWIGTAATITNGQQDARADKEGAKVQACFDRWAGLSTASSAAVRDASVAKDEATKKFNQALNEEGRAFKMLVQKILADDVEPADVKWLYTTLDRRDRTGRAVERAQDKLDEARKENPVPSAPSEFCSVKP